MAQRFGVTWQDVHKGLTDIESVSRDVVMSISSRRQAVLGLGDDLGYFTASARQKAAVATGPGKDHGVEASEFSQSWIGVLAETGFDRDAAAALARNGELQPWCPDDTDALFAHLASNRGVTEQNDGYDVMGAAPFGKAARRLEAETRLTSHTRRPPHPNRDRSRPRSAFLRLHPARTAPGRERSGRLR